MRWHSEYNPPFRFEVRIDGEHETLENVVEFETDGVIAKFKLLDCFPADDDVNEDQWFVRVVLVPVANLRWADAISPEPVEDDVLISYGLKKKAPDGSRD